MATMRAWQVVRHGEPNEALELVDVPVPEPAPGEIRLRVDAATLGLPDVFMCRGTYPFTPTLPFTPGQEVVGTITAVGRQATQRVGARLIASTAFVRGSGGFAEECLASSTGNWFPPPGGMSDAQAASFLIAYHTAWIALVRRAQLEPGETLVVTGAAGGSGAAAVQLGAALGARVIAVAGGHAKAEVCSRLGAHAVIDHNRDDVAASVRSLTGDRGADVVFEPVGGDVFDEACRYTASEGRILLIGAAGGAFGTARLGRFMMRNVSVMGVFAGAYSHDDWAHDHAELLRLHRDGKLAPLVETIPFDDLPAGLTRLADRRATGRLVLVPAG